MDLSTPHSQIEQSLRPRRYNPRGFNPDLIAYYEAAGWKAYYERDWPRIFGLMVHLIEAQFHIPFPRSFLAAVHVVSAAIAFVPLRHDLTVVRRRLERYYRMGAQAGGTFDPGRAAELEVRYWVVHRELAGRSDKRLFVDTMVELHTEVFGYTPAEVRPSAVGRVEACNVVELITHGQSADPAADWLRAEEHLRRGYRHLKAVMSGNAHR